MHDYDWGQDYGKHDYASWDQHYIDPHTDYLGMDYE